MGEPYNTTGIELSAGDFRKAIDFLDGDIEIVIDREGLKLRSGPKRSTVTFSDSVDAEVPPSEKKWILDHDSLSSIAKLIPDDTSYWESLSGGMELDLEHYEMRNLPRKADWKSHVDLWCSDSVYREMRSEHSKAKCHIPSLGCFLHPDKIELYLSFNDYADVASIEIMSKNCDGSEWK